MNMTTKRLWVMLTVLALAAGAGAQTFTVLKTFNPNINATGLHAKGTLAQGPEGTLYGIAMDGGAGAAGLVFRIQTNGTGFTVIKNFPLTDVITGTNGDGANPQAGLVLSGSTLFGTTMNGGSGGKGTVFSLDTARQQFHRVEEFHRGQRRSGSQHDADAGGQHALRNHTERRSLGSWNSVLAGSHDADSA